MARVGAWLKTLIFSSVRYLKRFQQRWLSSDQRCKYTFLYQKISAEQDASALTFSETTQTSAVFWIQKDNVLYFLQDREL